MYTEAAVGRAEASAEVPGRGTCTSNGDQQQPAGQDRGRSGPLRGRTTRTATRKRRWRMKAFRVYSAVLAARRCRRGLSHPALRTAGEPAPRGEAAQRCRHLLGVAGARALMYRPQCRWPAVKEAAEACANWAACPSMRQGRMTWSGGRAPSRPAVPRPDARGCGAHRFGA